MIVLVCEGNNVRVRAAHDVLGLLLQRILLAALLPTLYVCLKLPTLMSSSHALPVHVQSSPSVVHKLAHHLRFYNRCGARWVWGHSSPESAGEEVVHETWGRKPAAGGYTTGRQEVVDMLRQKARPYLFSNSLAPAVVGASLAALDLLEASTELRDRLEQNTAIFRKAISQVPSSFEPCCPLFGRISWISRTC